MMMMKICGIGLQYVFKNICNIIKKALGGGGGAYGRQIVPEGSDKYSIIDN